MADGKTIRGLVLAGGGARGSYQIGARQALAELGWWPNLITGTSVGSLNGAMFVLGEDAAARDMWLTIRSQDVMTLPDEDSSLTELQGFLRDVVSNGGMDVSPLESIIDRVLDEDKMRSSPVGFGLVTVERQGMQARELTLEEIPKGKLKDYLLASAACFPAMRAREIDGVTYLDGGYADNMPTALAQRMGAEELICVDLAGVGVTRPNTTGLPTTTIRSHWDLGSILRFDPDVARRNMELGYYDTLRAFGRVRGSAYAVAREDEDATAFRTLFNTVWRQVGDMYPAAQLSAAVSLALTDLDDEELAPLEAAAEAAGVDPTIYYTVRGLGWAFLEKCDTDAIAALDPVLDGTASTTQAARAAVNPQLLIEALVYRALTTMILPQEG